MPAGLAPDLAYDDRRLNAIRPSWNANPGFLNPGHEEIFEKTKDLPGWQDPGDSYKLYEMAYFAGDVILEIGVYGGRSAVVELRGALSNPERDCRPQLFALDVDPAAIDRSLKTLKAEGLDEYTLLFLGDIEAFMSRFNIRPTMVFVDGDHAYEGVRRDLFALSELLPAGVPVLCHDYLNPENDTGEYGVRRAAHEWEEAGYAAFCGAFGCAALFRTTDRCRGPRTRLADAVFTREREALLIQYGLGAAVEPPEVAIWRERAQAAQAELRTAEAMREAAQAELQRVYASRTHRLVSAVGRAVVQPIKRSLRGPGRA